jgi:hypothetical protein
MRRMLSQLLPHAAGFLSKFGHKFPILTIGSFDPEIMHLAHHPRSRSNLLQSKVSYG